MAEGNREEAWWKLPGDQICRNLDTDSAAGLSVSSAQARLQSRGPNELPEKEGASPLVIFINQFRSVLVLVLFFAAAVAGLLGEWMDSAAIAVILLLNGILGFVQEYKAEKSLAALKKLANPVSRVIRGGRPFQIPSRELVPGDLLLIEAGDRIPADCRILESIELQTQEASLTGESLPVAKSSGVIGTENPGLGDRFNMAFMGTVAVSGKGRAIVTETGLMTQLGKIARMLQSAPPEQTPLQLRLEQLGRRLVAIFLGVVTIVFAAGMLRGHGWAEMLLTSLSLAVAAIPEGLPAVVTIALAIGVRRMARRNALIRRLPSVETLGCATVICSDKTGTLTKNEMTVEKVWAGGKLFDVSGTGYAPEGGFSLEGTSVVPVETPGLRKVLEPCVLCNNADLQQAGGEWKVLGDPTEGALLTLAAKAGLEKEALEKHCPRAGELPFDSDRKMMSILRETSEGKVMYVKGAPDVIIRRSSKIFLDGKEAPLSAALKEQVEKANEGLASQAYRVLAFAYRPGPAAGEKMKEEELVFAGLAAMMDPERPEVRQAIAACRKSGIVPVMITGDHKATALAIAARLGMTDGTSLALSGSELDSMSQENLEEKVESIAVYARVSAEHKLRIVRAWKTRGAVAAMTGDGVNDAPAVKEADIGIAMGITGTDVTKEASDMIITDDNFASIVSAVEEGRGIYDNIVKFVKFLLSFNLAEILVLFTGILLGFRDAEGIVLIPLSAVQILWMNLVTDGLPAVALALDPLDPEAMGRPPRKSRESLFTRGFIADLALISILSAAGALAAFGWGARSGAAEAQTMTLTALVLLELVGVQIVRSGYHVGLGSNRWLAAALAFSFLLQIAIIYMPPLQGVFGMTPLGAADWLVLAGITGAVVLLARGIHRSLGIR